MQTTDLGSGVSGMMGDGGGGGAAGGGGRGGGGGGGGGTPDSCQRSGPRCVRRDTIGAATVARHDGSTLTRLLRPALSPEARVALVCCIDPSEAHAEEALDVLGFASPA